MTSRSARRSRRAAARVERRSEDEDFASPRWASFAFAFAFAFGRPPARAPPYLATAGCTASSANSRRDRDRDFAFAFALARLSTRVFVVFASPSGAPMDALADASHVSTPAV